MGQLVFQATLGGQTNLVGGNTASTYNLNVPMANDTLVGKATTDTLTNKTISGSSNTITNVAASSVATTNFSIVESGGKLYFKYGATNIASIDSSGNFIVLANSTAYGTP